MSINTIKRAVFTLLTLVGTYFVLKAYGAPGWMKIYGSLSFCTLQNILINTEYIMRKLGMDDNGEETKD